jgi:hypothetical protein
MEHVLGISPGTQMRTLSISEGRRFEIQECYATKMSEADLRQRLVSFEKRLAEAERMSVAQEPLPPKFSASFTTEKPQNWTETIKLIRERIASIQDQFEVG